MFECRIAKRRGIRKCINYEMQHVLFDENVCEWWEIIKGKIKKRSIRYAKQRDFMRRSRVEEMENELKREVEKLENNPEQDKERCEQIKAEIEDFEKEKSKGAIMSRAQYALERERSTKFFLNFEKTKEKAHNRAGKWKR